MMRYVKSMGKHIGRSLKIVVIFSLLPVAKEIVSIPNKPLLLEWWWLLLMVIQQRQLLRTYLVSLEEFLGTKNNNCRKQTV